jgi:hypothetical protein
VATFSREHHSEAKKFYRKRTSIPDDEKQASSICVARTMSTTHTIHTCSLRSQKLITLKVAYFHDYYKSWIHAIRRAFLTNEATAKVITVRPAMADLPGGPFHIMRLPRFPPSSSPSASPNTTADNQRLRKAAPERKAS